jgi:hypothetical protein
MSEVIAAYFVALLAMGIAVLSLLSLTYAVRHLDSSHD